MSSSANGIPQDHTPRRRSTTWYDEKGGYPREYTHKGNDNAILYQILTCADCLDAATDSVGRLITAEREQLYREVFGKNVELVL